MICSSVRMLTGSHTPTRASNRASLAEVERSSVSRCFHGGATIDDDDNNGPTRRRTGAQPAMEKGLETPRGARKVIPASIP